MDPSLRLNAFLTLRPDLDGLDPLEREIHWKKVYNHIQVTCRDKGFKFVGIMVRESVGLEGQSEHLHCLLHVPDDQWDAVKALIEGDTRKGKPRRQGWPGRNKLKRADYSVTYTAAGKRRSAVGYLLKSAHPQDRYRDKAIWHKQSGPIFGWRLKITRNLQSKARATAAPAIRARQRIDGEKAYLNRLMRQVEVKVQMASTSPGAARDP